MFLFRPWRVDYPQVDSVSIQCTWVSRQPSLLYSSTRLQSTPPNKLLYQAGSLSLRRQRRTCNGIQAGCFSFMCSLSPLASRGVGPSRPMTASYAAATFFFYSLTFGELLPFTFFALSLFSNVPPRYVPRYVSRRHGRCRLPSLPPRFKHS